MNSNGAGCGGTPQQNGEVLAIHVGISTVNTRGGAHQAIEKRTSATLQSEVLEAIDPLEKQFTPRQ